MRRILWTAAITFALSAVASAMVGMYSGRKPDMRVGELLFEPKDDEALPAIEEFAAQHGGKIHKVTKVLQIYLMTFQPVVPREKIDRFRRENPEKFWEEYEKCRQQVLDVVKELESTGLVAYAQPNFIYYIAYTPNDPYFVDDGAYGPDEGPDQYGFFITNCEGGWDFTTGSRDVLLCIIDSGVDVDHPDLADNIWINPGEDIDGDGELYDLDDLNGVDDDGDGYVDDLFGYDFVGGNIGFFTDDVTEEDWNPDIHYMGDDGWGEPDPSCGTGLLDFGVSHGTHCAGIAGAVMDNDIDFAGAAGHITIVPVRAATPLGNGYSADLAAGIEYAAMINADVASMSFGTREEDPAVLRACQLAYEHGVALIAASGNDSADVVYSPASSPYTLAVGSFNSHRERSHFSNYGSALDVLAAGGDATSDGWTATYIEVIWSTWVVSVYEAGTLGVEPGTHSIAGEIGTSMATPQAAGLAALIKSLCPDIPPDSVYNIIRNTAQDVGTPGWDPQTGYGIID
ncbi:MAG TPA: hypothetical protein ENG11_01675, partial [candidate division Zixibacteria bacterium]|nr:hypothetical protein [candidate division Zixibacteria bacterium]